MWIFEQPLPIVMVGLLAIAISGGLWVRFGRPWLLYTLGAAVALTVLLLLLERWVVTDREQVAATVRRGAAAVEQNDLEAVLAFVHPRAREIRQRVEREFPQYDFREVRIARNLKVDVDRTKEPPRARATFNVIVTGSDKQSLIQDQRIVRFVELEFELDEDGQWRVIQYAHAPPTQAFIREDGGPADLLEDPLEQARPARPNAASRQGPRRRGAAGRAPSGSAAGDLDEDSGPVLAPR